MSWRRRGRAGRPGAADADQRAAGGRGGGSPDVGGGVGQAVALRLWVRQDAATEAAFRALADGYATANPGVTIAIEPLGVAAYEQTLADSLAGGVAADLFEINGASLCSHSPHLAPATQPVLDTNPAGRFDAALLAPFVCEGVVYGLPQASAAPWGLAVSATSAAVDVAWDFVRYATE